MDRWVGKNAVITGAASGMGAAISQTLLEKGISVIGLDIQTERLEKMSEKNPLFHGITCDVSRGKDLELKLLEICEKFRGIDIMVNNAGVVDYSPIIEGDRETFERLMNINVLAYATCTSVAVKSMRQRKVEGHIFNINSIVGHDVPLRGLSDVEGSNSFSLYPASKHATVAMTHSVRREIVEAKLPIKITSISPGLVKTEIVKGTILANLFDEMPSLDPKDVAEALLYALGTRPEVQITELTIRRIEELS